MGWVTGGQTLVMAKVWYAEVVTEAAVGWRRLRDKCLRWVVMVWLVRPVVLVWSHPALWGLQGRLNLFFST